MTHLLQDVMTRPVAIGSPDLSLRQAAEMMRDGDYGFLPIGENDRLIGAITDRDIAVRAVADGKDPNVTKVAEVMSEGTLYAFDDQTAEEAATIMATHQVRRLPVLNRDKRLVGVVALGDFAVRADDVTAGVGGLSGVSEPT
ncbi:CBS domain-containing protein [Marinivivus vitaminiproducens]|uniref:CBS domain-containing protein n=1 Tax=Marinivivus vitaminiproducens TaxID=3035935 RepID=UPI0027A22408|nr:CBS domain-containing protein [Geminicoccaceae bacterium SCSIO 64248]